MTSPACSATTCTPRTSSVVRVGHDLEEALRLAVAQGVRLAAPDQLEELRLLSNAEMDSQSPFALLLVGQPTLARQLRLWVFAALDQRIATRYQLAPMDLAEAAEYL